MNYPKFTRKNTILKDLRELHFYEVYTLRIAFLHFHCIIEVCEGDMYIRIYPEHMDRGFPECATETISYKRNWRRRQAFLLPNGVRLSTEKQR